MFTFILSSCGLNGKGYVIHKYYTAPSTSLEPNTSSYCVKYKNGYCTQYRYSTSYYVQYNPASYELEISNCTYAKTMNGSSNCQYDYVIVDKHQFDSTQTGEYIQN